MLGSALYREFKANGHECFAAIRRSRVDLDAEVEREFQPTDLICDVDALSPDSVTDLLRQLRPDFLLNAVGLTPRRSINDKSLLIQTNSVLPHQLAKICEKLGVRMVHYSTDCVFKGQTQGPTQGYTENDRPDADDDYGLSKRMGEVLDQDHVLTLRGSIVGLELQNHTELLEWFISQRNTKEVVGFKAFHYSGMTTTQMAKVTLKCAQMGLSGLWHASGPFTTKYDLLQTAAREFQFPVQVVPDIQKFADKRLSSERLAKVIGPVTPDWGRMLAEQAAWWHERQNSSPSSTISQNNGQKHQPRKSA